MDARQGQENLSDWKTKNDNTARNRVYVKVKAGIPNIQVHLKAFDVDYEPEDYDKALALLAFWCRPCLRWLVPTQPQRKNPGRFRVRGFHGYWRRPTLAQPIDALPSALRCFTSVFGMGTGGATALRPPDFCDPTSQNGDLKSQGVWRHRIANIAESKSVGSLTSTHGVQCNRIYKFLYKKLILTSAESPGEPGAAGGRKNDQAERVISIPELNTLLCLYPGPINVVVFHDPSGRSHLGRSLALRCFQRLSLPNIATRHCR